MELLFFLDGFWLANNLAPHHEPTHTSAPAPSERLTSADPKPVNER